jgi:hypothetical protein
MTVRKFTVANGRRVLSEHELLGRLKAKELKKLLASARVQRFGAGEILFRRGDRGDKLFVVLSGRIMIGTIPVDPSDDAGDGGGNSKGVSPANRTTDPNSHTPVGVKLAANHRTRHLRRKENHRHRTGYVDNSLTRVLAHTHCATTTAFSS